MNNTKTFLLLSFVIFITSSCSSLDEPLAGEESDMISPEDAREFISEEVSVGEEYQNEIVTIQDEPTPECVMLEDFGDQTTQYTWGIVNDGVMGGLSQGSRVIEEDSLVFSGTINTNGGGFSLLRASISDSALVDYDYMIVRLRSDSRTYNATFRSRWSGISYQQVLSGTENTEWQEIFLSFRDFYPTYFGRRIEADAFDVSTVREMGVIISDGLDGPFRLEIDQIQICKDETSI